MFKNLFAVLKKLKECVGFFFFNNLIATNVLQIGNRFNVANVLLCSRCDLLTKNYNYDYKRIY